MCSWSLNFPCPKTAADARYVFLIVVFYFDTCNFILKANLFFYIQSIWLPKYASIQWLLGLGVTAIWFMQFFVMGDCPPHCRTSWLHPRALPIRHQKHFLLSSWGDRKCAHVLPNEPREAKVTLGWPRPLSTVIVHSSPSLITAVQGPIARAPAGPSSLCSIWSRDHSLKHSQNSLCKIQILSFQDL